MNPALVLCHQDIILLSLLLRLNLRIERVYVLLLHFLLFHLGLSVQIIHIANPVCSLVCKQFVILSLKLFLGLLFKHLEAKSLICLSFAPYVHIAASLAIEGLTSLPFSHLLEHELLVATSGLAHVPLRLVVAQRLQLLLVANLEVLHLEEVLRATLLILGKFARLSLDKHLVLLFGPIVLLKLV